MKSFRNTRSALLLSALAAATSLAGMAQAAPQSSAAVALSEGDCEASRCVMVFARVGEQFRYELSPAGGDSSAECAVGSNASGDKSSLPQGLVFNAQEGRLEGVPQRSGFHEFVVVQTENGVAQEQVVLIDIQGHAFASGVMDYASYVARGMR